MKAKLMIAFFALTLGLQVQAAKSKASQNKETKTQKVESSAGSGTDSGQSAPSFAPKKGRLGTDFSFSGSHVDGKFLSAGESVAEVEGEKGLGALIGIRKNFRDRLAAERARLKSEGK
ncbi:MAG: hypothetical protein AAB250_10235 [Bdellovibrionota bacterium]